MIQRTRLRKAGSSNLPRRCAPRCLVDCALCRGSLFRWSYCSLCAYVPPARPDDEKTPIAYPFSSPALSSFKDFFMVIESKQHGRVSEEIEQLKGAAVVVEVKSR